MGGFSRFQIRAQGLPTTGLSFEVASVKRDQAGACCGFPQFLPGGSFRASADPLEIMMDVAYGLPLKSYRISRGPDWVRSETELYTIEAKPPAGAIPAGLPLKDRDEKIRFMLQQLLADRFHLKIRRETRQLPVYALIVGKNGPKLQKSQIQERDCTEGALASATCHHFGGGLRGGMDLKSVDLADVAQFVSTWTDRPVIDRTAIRGLYDVKTESFAPMRSVRPPVENNSSPPNPDRPTVFQIFDRLGLKLESQTGPVDLFVIDHVERPTEN